MVNDAVDKLRDGPCATIFHSFETCASTKGISMSKQKDMISACPNEIDALIKCMNKNPLFFQK